MTLFAFLQDNLARTLFLAWEHVWLVGLSLLIAMCTGIPIGIAITRSKDLAQKVLAGANVIMTVPSIALFGLMLPILAIVGHGLGKVPAVIALVLYSLLPIIRNTFIAIKNVDPALVDAGRGMGMGKWRLLREVEIPLAVPVILAGLKTAAVMNIGIAAIAAYVGAGGLGVFIQQGIARSHETMILTGALAVSLLAIVVDLAMSLLERWVTPKGLKI
ncbi:ABC transporter permease [Desulfatitalea alkaliphila]|uniref:ABC transporter permease n=1 Tax=Desulfatitalea alkaliphila TaxID=2929485 RepID=A0AA41R2Q9_9BACT|nr:ABC transporter permease [Desulfatitalea alkaliphila]MCJ8499676.1 ABC transporter permease [Desulfatitalea alkaliphila]